MGYLFGSSVFRPKAWESSAQGEEAGIVIWNHAMDETVRGWVFITPSQS